MREHESKYTSSAIAKGTSIIVTIPQDICKIFGIKKKDKLGWDVDIDKKELILKKIED